MGAALRVLLKFWKPIAVALVALGAGMSEEQFQQARQNSEQLVKKAKG